MPKYTSSPKGRHAPYMMTVWSGVVMHAKHSPLGKYTGSNEGVVERESDRERESWYWPVSALVLIPVPLLVIVMALPLPSAPLVCHVSLVSLIFVKVDE
jgi:hypothetical protein